jgi:hypothetical protein
MSRLGVISYLFENRHSIAVAAGLLVEKPIATCSSDYFPDKTICIIDHPDEASTSVRFIQAQEINLFFQYVELTIQPLPPLLPSHHQILSNDQYFPPLLSGIFHPPSIV